MAIQATMAKVVIELLQIISLIPMIFITFTMAIFKKWPWKRVSHLLQSVLIELYEIIIVIPMILVYPFILTLGEFDINAAFFM